MKCRGKDAPSVGEANKVVRLAPLPCDASIRSEVFPRYSSESTAFAYRNDHYIVQSSTFGSFVSVGIGHSGENRAISSRD